MQSETQDSKGAEAQSVLELASAVKKASAALAALDAGTRNKALLAIADELEKNTQQVLAANKKDLDLSHPLFLRGEMSHALFSRLDLDQSKMRTVIEGMRQIAALPDPVGRVDLARELDEGLALYRVTCPIGVVAVIFESRPDVLPQIAALCLKSGNAVILKGGREAENTNRATFAIIQSTARKLGIPGDAFGLIHTRENVENLLKADEFVNLIIPRGSNDLVRHIQRNTHIPVLGHADGICHVYIDEAASLEKAIKVTVDSKVQYPSACNAAETLLVHSKIAGDFLPAIAQGLIKRTVEIHADDEAFDILKGENVSSEYLHHAQENSWRTEYCDLHISVRIVDSLQSATDHINKFGSGHTDTIVTELKENFEAFFARVNSAGVYWNASTRFADGFRYGFGAEVGISTGKLHPRGPVGVEGLVTYKYKLIGNGHIVADYTGPGARSFKHKDL